jgi:aspartate racemase
MKTVGIVGGIGPESTIDYYRQIIAAYRKQKPDGSYPSLVINSIDAQKMLGMIATNELAGLTEFLVGEVQRLAKAGADFGVLAANTPHKVFEEIRQRSSIPLISIVEATCAEAKAQGLKRLGLFGTKFTMQGRFYPDALSKEGIELVLPSEDEQTYIHEKYLDELVNGVFRPETRTRLLAIADRLRDQEAIQGLILGGTELPLILKDVTDLGISFLDTTQIHVAAIVDRLVA